jgi:hypothetical protein
MYGDNFNNMDNGCPIPPLAPNTVTLVNDDDDDDDDMVRSRRSGDTQPADVVVEMVVRSNAVGVVVKRQAVVAVTESILTWWVFGVKVGQWNAKNVFGGSVTCVFWETTTHKYSELGHNFTQRRKSMDDKPTAKNKNANKCLSAVGDCGCGSFLRCDP